MILTRRTLLGAVALSTAALLFSGPAQSAAPTPPAPQYFVAISTSEDTASVVDDVDAMLQRWSAQTGWSFSRAATASVAGPASCDHDSVTQWARAQFPEVDRYNPEQYVVAVTACSEDSWAVATDPSTGEGRVIGLNRGHDPVSPTLFPWVASAMGIPAPTSQLIDREGRLVGLPPDRYSPLSSSVPGHLPPALGSATRARLHVTQPGEIATFDEGSPDLDITRTFTLSPRGGSSGLRGVTVRDPFSLETYWFEYRDHAGLDATAPYGNDVTENRVHWGTGVTVQTGWDQHLQPALQPGGDDEPLRWDGAYATGSSFTTEGLRVSFGTQDSQATITVTMRGRYAAAFSGGEPRIVGPVRVGSTVKAAFDPITPRPTHQSIQWLADGRAIKGATTTRYTIPASRLHQKLSVRLRADKDHYVPINRRTAAVTIGRGHFTAHRPVIKGSLTVGSTARVALGTWSPRSTYTAIRWYANGKPIASATQSKLRITRALRGKKLTVRARGTRTAYADLTLTSQARRVPR